MASQTHDEIRGAEYFGLRMSADEYLDLPDDGFRYELVNGVICMAPNPTFGHQSVITEITYQLEGFLRGKRIGRVVAECDVRLDAETVYRPDLVFVTNAKVPPARARISAVPDMVLEILSPDSRNYDRRTRRGDYERAGVGEYWIIDPLGKTYAFLRHDGARFVEVAITGDEYRSAVIPEFVLDLAAVREVMGD